MNAPFFSGRSIDIPGQMAEEDGFWGMGKRQGLRIVPERKGISLFLGLKKDRPFLTLLILGVSLILTLSSGYACYDELQEADCLSTSAKYETQDLGDFFLEKQNLANGVAKASNPDLLFGEISRAIRSLFSLPPAWTDPTHSVLRC